MNLTAHELQSVNNIVIAWMEELQSHDFHELSIECEPQTLYCKRKEELREGERKDTLWDGSCADTLRGKWIYTNVKIRRLSQGHNVIQFDGHVVFNETTKAFLIARHHEELEEEKNRLIAQRYKDQGEELRQGLAALMNRR